MGLYSYSLIFSLKVIKTKINKLKAGIYLTLSSFSQDSHELLNFLVVPSVLIFHINVKYVLSLEVCKG